jgi:hypothetical protein
MNSKLLNLLKFGNIDNTVFRNIPEIFSNKFYIDKMINVLMNFYNNNMVSLIQ